MHVQIKVLSLHASHEAFPLTLGLTDGHGAISSDHASGSAEDQR